MKVFKVFIILIFFIGFSKAFSSKDCEEAFLSSNNLSQNLSSNSSSINLSSSVKEQTSFKPSGFYKSIGGLFRFFSQSFNNNQKPITSVKPSNPKELSQLITQGALLSKGQELEFNYHLTKTFTKDLSRKGLKDVLNVEKKHPPGSLNKIPIRPQIITFVLKQKAEPKSLALFLKSFKSQGNKTKEMYQISSNWGFWAKLLLFESKGLNKQQRREAFFEYLNQSPLAQSMGEFIKTHDFANTQQTVKEFIEDPLSPYKQKTIVFYKVLEGFRKQLIKQKQDTEKLSLAMAQLIYFTGFNNPVWFEQLKDKNPLVVMEAVSQILSEKDLVAIDLSFTDTHYKGLENALLDSFHSPQVKSVKKELSIIEDQVADILKDLETQPVVATSSETFTLRTLSLQESPFRGCLGKDCSTGTYFLKALDPAYLYFTLTDKDFISHGQITVVLGMAKNKKGKTVKTAFVDKIQNIPNHRIIPMLEGIRISLTEHGYKLALPKDVGYGNGLSNSRIIRNFVQNKILPDLKNTFYSFKTIKTKLSYLKDGYSRAGFSLSLLEFKTAKKDFKIQTQEIPSIKKIDDSFKIKNWFLENINSKNEKDHFLIIANLTNLIEFKILSRKKALNYLKLKIKDRFLSFKLRKQALFSAIELKNSVWRLYKHEDKTIIDDFMFIESLLLEFSHKELETLIGEMSNWKHTNKGSRKNFVISLSYIFVLSLKFIDFDLPKKLLGLFKPVIDINIKDNEGMSLLHHAVADQDLKLVKILLQQGANPHSKDKANSTSLYYAIDVGDLKMVDFLIEKGLDIHAKDSSGLSLLSHAIKFKRTKIVKLLLDKGAYLVTKDRVDHSLYLAVSSGQIEIVKLLLDKGADPNKIDPYGQNSLYYVKHKEILRLLLDKGADINLQDNEGKTPIFMALNTGDKYIFKLLIEWGADIKAKDNFGRSLLHIAAYKAYKDIVELLLKKGLDPNTQDNSGQTPLYRAVLNADKEIFKLLIKWGANFNIQDNFGNSLLQVAVDTNTKNMIELLFKIGVDPNTQDNNGKTPLFTAIFFKKTSIVQLLLKNGVDPNLKENYGHTPLHMAIKLKNKKIIELLLKNGADPNIKSDHIEQTSLDYAISEGYEDIIPLLKSYGAK